VATEEESFDTFSLTLFPLARKKGENKKTEKKKKSVVSFFKGVQCANFTIKKKLESYCDQQSDFRGLLHLNVGGWSLALGF
jgi:hypothetical protein